MKIIKIFIAFRIEAESGGQTIFLINFISGDCNNRSLSITCKSMNLFPLK